MRTVLGLGFAALLVGCGDPNLANKVADLEKRVEAVEKKSEELAKARPAGPAQGASPEDENAAGQILKEVQQLSMNGDYEGAKTKLAELKAKYGSTRAARAAQRIEMELEVIGKDAPALNVEKWYQGEGTSFSDGKATLVVFWEVWCPHCKREVPKLEATSQSWKGKGLNVIGLTKQTRDIKDEQVSSFVSENKISYAIAKEQGSELSEHFGVRGIPAAAVVKDGKIVWRGHPARITDDMLTQWTN